MIMQLMRFWVGKSRNLSKLLPDRTVRAPQDPSAPLLSAPIASRVGISVVEHVEKCMANHGPYIMRRHALALLDG